ncbi:soluble lytic murein transglycosylase-like protein [secondary endosymbiont of Heteropsylla cubana]|uniref:peptidoglycan lytic exotransglycosylase n=1 Tax=secondary endosymbiont of Heteropsylla cubana TaxID=134287 RepID=J3TZA5_9ENTR|nr:membrane-bound lytic murein transglycosylase MltC [secondary endosymbiont of Heteropsylla cubana]AFP85840.1 soluble lytic murein transglycosylase-like protein [secondary endosymbiont of Heteropsylla cubana]
MKKNLLLLIIFPLLTSCSANNYNKKHQHHIKDIDGFNIFVGQFANNIETMWGIKKVLIAKPRDYIKYTDHYQTRIHINFDLGVINIETINTENPIARLRQAIISTILMSKNTGIMTLYADASDIPISNEPFLYGQVVDQDNHPIRFVSQAANFANHLLQTRLEICITNPQKIWSVTIKLIPNHVDKRANEYLSMVKKSSRKYGIDQSLILAIIQAESSFNPYAVSQTEALGLMQIMKQSAGRDVFKMKGQWGEPSRSYLLDPQNNIDTGTAYLAILQNTYLSGITNPKSRHYAVITAYNSGAGSVLRVFSHDQTEALQIINGMLPDQVYQTLTTHHPSSESRRYLYKVHALQKHYRR